jgi:hypothetical protein
MSNDPNFPLLTSNFLQSGLPEGSYSVELTDNNTGCVTTGTVQIDDRRVYPEIMIVEDNPLINCDPARANGQLPRRRMGVRLGLFIRMVWRNIGHWNTIEQ